MSLVAYGSSDDSDSEGALNPVATEGKPSRGLFSLLPAPKRATSSDTLRNEGPSKEAKSHFSSGNGSPNDDLDSQASRGSLHSGLPKPKKRTEPIRITVPQIQREDSDSDDDGPAKKKLQTPGLGTGLSSLLPQPKNLTVKETNRPLVPHTLTKRIEPKGPKPPTPAQGVLDSSASPSAIKAAAKSAALQLARQMATDDQDNEEEVPPENYFSLGDSSPPLPVVAQSADPDPVVSTVINPFVPGAETGQSDAPLDFGVNHEEVGAGPWAGQPPQYQQPIAGPEAYPQGYYNEQYYQDPNSGFAEAEEPGSSAMFDDEAFMRLQGKRNRGKEEVKFLEIKGDDQLSGTQQWMTKSITEEKQERQSFSKKKGDQPTGQQRRKHQITYLIHQAKERELELKNNWADNKLTRRQTQAKYGF
ncbi:proline-rich protein PRCC [Lampris incognitus]|uniref:proline-rich protein PRCC n=1 Tax=Lampris incognitus TaxID=2546036 RepID=UPI0024B4E735|nr:proline-rich protein PRCC [Lampris incognitus]